MTGPFGAEYRLIPGPSVSPALVDEHVRRTQQRRCQLSTDKDVVEILVNIPVNAGPISGMVAIPDGSRLVVTNYGHNSVSSLDTDSGRVLETVAGVNEPFAIAMGQAEGIAYVSSVSRAYDSIEVIDLVANEVIATHPLALTVSDLAVSADDGTSTPADMALAVPTSPSWTRPRAGSR